MNLDDKNLFVEATKHIRSEVIDEKLYFSANGIYTFITESNTTPSHIINRYKKYVCFNKVNKHILKGSKHHFTYALTYEDAIKFINIVTNTDKNHINAAESFLIGRLNDFALNNSQIAREELNILKSKINILENALYNN